MSPKKKLTGTQITFIVLGSVAAALLPIIAIVLAIALPNFNKYRAESQKQACLSNMDMLRTAGESWLMRSSVRRAPQMDDLCGGGGDKYIRQTPTCPKDGSSYTIGLSYDDGITVRCPNHGSLDSRY